MDSVLKNVPIGDGGDVSPSEIREELARVLRSLDFKASPRRREMLVYLVDEMLAGRGHELKGYTIGVAVFRRGEDFDAQADPVVRLEARRLRRDLDGYYVAAGRSNPLRISIPTGHYTPEIRRLEPQASKARGQEDFQYPNSVAESRMGVDGPVHGDAAGQPKVGRRHGTVAGALAAGLLLVACFAYLFVPSWREIDNRAAVTRGTPLLLLPFRAYGEDSKASYLATGISEQLMADLGRFSDIQLYLSPDTGTQQAYDDLIGTGTRAGASFVLTGSVRTEASHIKIGAQLIDVKSARIIWAEQFDRTPSPGTLLSVQNEIGAAISTALGQPYGIIRDRGHQWFAGWFCAEHVEL